MPLRKHRLLVGSLGSIVWPAIVVLIPAGITFAAARVYAESAPAPSPEACEAGVVADCADASVGAACKACQGGNCACFSGTCTDGGPGSFTDVKVCRGVSTCESFPDGDMPCQGKAEGAACGPVVPGSGAVNDGLCKPSPHDCLPNDGGGLMTTSRGLFCYPTKANASSTSSSGSSGPPSSDEFPRGPDTVPGSSSSSSSSGEPAADDSGCSSSGSSSLPLIGAPVALGLLLALRKRARRKKS